MATDAARLSPRARALLEDATSELFVSAASIWEIAIKERSGKLPAMSERLPALIERNGFVRLPIDHRHARRAGLLVADHRDRFDRMLAAQSEIEGIDLVSVDPRLFGDGGCRDPVVGTR